jgi:hypothetical protein
MVTHVKENINKGNHAQHLKYENNVSIKYFGKQDTYFSCNNENWGQIKKDCMKYERWLKIKIIAYI